MVRPRSRSRHAKRLLAGLCSTFVAAGAMAYSTGGGQQHHADEAPKTQVASNDHGSGGDGGGDTPMDVLENNGDGDAGGGGGGGGGGVGLAGGDGTGGSPSQTGGASHGVYGPGDASDGPGSNGFMPNGEDGLMILADYTRTQGDGENTANGANNSDNTPGLPPGGFGSTDGANMPGGAGPDGGGTTQVADNAGSGGFGFGGGNGGGSFGGGGGLAGGGGSGGGIGGSVGGGGGVSGPKLVTTPGAGLTTPDPGTGAGTGDVGGKVCVVSALDTCGQPPANNGPTITPPNPQSLVTGPHGGGTPGDNAAGPGPAVPEPGTWLMMILGFGAAGSTLRAQRRKVRAALA